MNKLVFSNYRKNCKCLKDNCDKFKADYQCENKQISNCYKYIMGMPGSIGPTGPTGTSGVLNYADFYALMPPDNAAALTITPVAGGTEPVSAHLVILQIQ